jgi:hypothetical protein
MEGQCAISNCCLKWIELDDGYIEIRCPIFKKGNMMPRYNNVMNVMSINNDKDAMICLLVQNEAKSMANLITLLCNCLGGHAMIRFLEIKK